MLTTAIRVSTALFLSLALLACGDKTSRMDMEVNVTLNGKLVPHAKIMMDARTINFITSVTFTTLNEPLLHLGRSSAHTTCLHHQNPKASNANTYIKGLENFCFDCWKWSSTVVVAQNDDPFGTQLIFDIVSPWGGKAEAELFNESGKTADKKYYTITTGLNRLSLDNTGKLPAGIYFLRIQSAGALIQKKVIKQNN